MFCYFKFYKDLIDYGCQASYENTTTTVTEPALAQYAMGLAPSPNSPYSFPAWLQTVLWGCIKKNKQLLKKEVSVLSSS